MPVLGNLLQKAIQTIEKGAARIKKPQSPFAAQKRTLHKLLLKAQFTDFGHTYNFTDMLHEMDFGKRKDFYAKFQQNVPTFNYDTLYKHWWHRAKTGEANVCWPGKVKYFALSSGTSESSSKYIPITKTMSRAIQRSSINQILSLGHFPDLPPELFETGMLMLGGSTNLKKMSNYYEGDLSGISAKQIPFWFQQFYKPGKKIAQNTDWDKKLDEIVAQAPTWDIGFLVGSPVWQLMLIEKIVAHHQVANIHKIWPNLSVFAHGGVSFEPYKKSFEKLLGHPILYLDTYLASEGFIAFQTRAETKAMKMILDGGIFFEFVPFNEENFDAEGNMVSKPETMMIDQVEEGAEYAILLSTCAGAWRYLIGDVIKFTDKTLSEVVIAGRTKHYISLTGEHLSVENMNRAIEQISEEFNISIKEFAVAGVPHGSFFAHQWYIGTDETADSEVLKEKIDSTLKQLNDDYAVERMAALRDVYVKVLPTHVFYDWMKTKGKIGGQHKFPRVLKKSQYEDWENFLKIAAK
ncbi:MAG: GH3 auxin-responsive promoter family protein [Verrucomicrobia bacterium]|nr:GH3 auxin-responsive promoter family protein [Cytophagales bacterium]